MIIGTTFFVNLFLFLLSTGTILDKTESSFNTTQSGNSQFLLYDSAANFIYHELDSISLIEKYLPFINTENIFIQGKNLVLQDKDNRLFSLNWNVKNLSFSKKFAFFQIVQGGDFHDPREICFSKYKIVNNRIVLYDLVRIDKNQFRNTIYQFYPVSENEFIACSFMLLYRIKITNSGENCTVKEKSLSNPYTVDGVKVVYPSQLKYNTDKLLIVCDKAILLYRIGLDQIEDVTGYLIQNKYIGEDQRSKLTVINANNDDFLIISQNGSGFRMQVKGKNYEVTTFDIEKFKLFPGKDNFSLIFDYSSIGILEIWREDGIIFKLYLVDQNKFTSRRFNLPFHPYQFLRADSETQILYASGEVFFRTLKKDGYPTNTVSKTLSTTDFDIGKVVNLGYTYGIAVGDIDNDEKEEILFVEPFGTNRLLKFDSKSEDYIEIKDRFPRDSYGNVHSDISGKFVDINNDSHPDLILSTMDSGGGLFLNNGNGYFQNVTKEYHLDSVFSRSESVTFADFNNDGWIDIFVSNFFASNKLLINKNGLEFEDQTKEYGLLSAGNSIHATVGDINNDGLTDLLVVGWNSKSKLYLNRNGGFTDVAEELGLDSDTTLLTNSALFADFNNDAFLDIFVSYRGSIPKLYLNQGGHVFRKVSDLLKEKDPSTIYGSVAADFNSDSFVDIAINCTDNAFIYFNYQDSSSVTGFSFIKKPLSLSRSSINPLKGYGTGLGVIDANRDGDLDLIVGQFKGLTMLYENMYVENNRKEVSQVNLKIHPVETNSSLAGVKVWGISEDSVYFFKEIGTGEGYCSQISSELNIQVSPLGDKSKIKIFFPVSGDTVTVDILESSYLDVFEHSSLISNSKRMFEKIRRMILQADFYIKIMLITFLAIVFFWYVHYDVNNYKLFFRNLELSFRQSLFIVSITFVISQVLVNLFTSEDLYNSQWRDQTAGSFGMFILPVVLSAGLVLASLKIQDIFSQKGMNYKPDVAKLTQQLYLFNHGEGRKSNLSSIALLLTNVRFYLSETGSRNNYIMEQLNEMLSEFKLLTLPAIKEILLSLSSLRMFAEVQFDRKDFQLLNRTYILMTKSAENLGKAIARGEYKLIASEAINMTGLIDRLGKVMNKIKIRSVDQSKIILNSYLGKIEKSYEKTKANGIEVKFVRIKEDIYLYTDSTKLSECINIFIKNSIESFYDSRNFPRQILIKVEFTADELEIIIEDNGIGISEAHMEKIFQKGFSTKGEKRGLGLIYAKRLLMELGAELDITSKEFQGTTIKIKLNYDKKELS